MKISDTIAEGMLNLHVWKLFVFSLNMLCFMRCKKDVSKSAGTATGFATEDEHLNKRLWVSKKCSKTIA